MLSIRAGFAICLILSAGLIGPARSYGTAQISSTQTLTLTRTESVENAVWGELYIDGKFVCYTLENDARKIPAGSYVIHKTQRGFRLEGVPGRTNINIEVGNYPFESLGCIFVGTKKTSRGVEGSKMALFRLIRAVRLPAVLVVA